MGPVSSTTSGARALLFAVVITGALYSGTPGAGLAQAPARRPAQQQQPARSAGWPAVTRETRPWTRWWWMGSAVDPPGLTADLESLEAAGLGGVEVTPIYGVAGTESQFVPYLSEEWVRLLEHTLREASRLGLGVDMATGTGWPFGGPWVRRGRRGARAGASHLDPRGRSAASRADPARSASPRSSHRLLGSRVCRSGREPATPSQAPDRRPRRPPRGEPQPAGARTRADPLSQAASPGSVDRVLEGWRGRRPHVTRVD